MDSFPLSLCSFKDVIIKFLSVTFVLLSDSVFQWYIIIQCFMRHVIMALLQLQGEGTGCSQDQCS